MSVAAWLHAGFLWLALAAGAPAAPSISPAPSPRPPPLPTAEAERLLREGFEFGVLWGVGGAILGFVVLLVVFRALCALGERRRAGDRDR